MYLSFNDMTLMVPDDVIPEAGRAH